MDLDLAFSVLNYSVVPAWLLLVFAPRWRGTERAVHSAFIPMLLGTAYGVLLFTDREGSPDGSFFTLDGVMAIFTSRQTVIAAWVHYLVFDLFVGAWQVRDAARRGVPHLFVVPCLALTLMLGPLGLIAYLLRADQAHRHAGGGVTGSCSAQPFRPTSMRVSRRRSAGVRPQASAEERTRRT